MSNFSSSKISHYRYVFSKSNNAGAYFKVGLIAKRAQKLIDFRREEKKQNHF